MESQGKMLLPLRLRLLRRQHHLSQQALADLLGLDRSSYSYYELSRSEPSIHTLMFLADYYQVSVDYLLGRVDDPSLPQAEGTEKTSGADALNKTFADK